MENTLECLLAMNENDIREIREPDLNLNQNNNVLNLNYKEDDQGKFNSL